MIGNMAVRVTADRPNFPLGTLFVRAGSAANIALVGVPVRPGVDVTALALRVENVDGATADYAARQLGGVWVVDVPATHFATVGSVTGGVSVWATGTGADGETPRTWCVGVGDLEVLPADADAPAPAPGQTFWPLRMFDAAPTSPTKYNAYIDGFELKIWNGTAWVTISGGSGTVDDAVTRTSANPVKSYGIWGAIWGALTALPTGFASLYEWCVAQLANTRDKGDIAVYTYAPWACTYSAMFIDPFAFTSDSVGFLRWNGADDQQSVYVLEYDKTTSEWMLWKDGDTQIGDSLIEEANVTQLDFGNGFVFTRERVYDPASPADTLAKTSQIPSVTGLAPLASPAFTGTPTAPTAAAGTATTQIATTAFVQGAGAGKQDALSAEQLANIAAVPGKADAADLRYRIAEAGYATTGARLPGEVTVKIGGETIPTSALVMYFQQEATDTPLWVLGTSGEDIATWYEDGTPIGYAGDYRFYDGEQELQTPPGLVFPRALADRTVNLITATDETSIDIELPDEVYKPTGVRRARDFFLDIDNSANANDLALEFPYLGSGNVHGFALVPLADETIGEITTIGAGERARLYFTETPYYAEGGSSLPVIQIARCTLGDFVTSTTPATQGGS